MERPASYNTRQRESVLRYILSLEGQHVTAAQIVHHFKDAKSPIGRTTVYRHLDRLVESGHLRRYAADSGASACYQQTDGAQACHAHLHLKCEDCGVLQHLQCKELQGLQQHLLQHHAFTVNALKTVLYGKCQKCLHES